MKPKKLLIASAALTIFALAMIFFQLSCKKSANAQNNSATASQINKLIFKRITSSNSREIWTSNYDGSNANRINILLPNGIVFSDDMSPKLSPDGQKVFFEAGTSNQTKISGDLYVCNVDGTGVRMILDRAGGNIILGGVY